jgi:DNA adenine methylase
MSKDQNHSNVSMGGENTIPAEAHEARPMKPIISYYGGKQRLASRICGLIPRHTVYVEPFCGGAAVFFRKPWPTVKSNHHYYEVLNDTNGDIVNLYRCFQDKDKAERLIHRLQFTLYARVEHALRKQPTDDPVERAARFYCDVQMSFSNIVGGGWGTSVFGRNSAATWANKIASLPQYLERMAAVHIECEDALQIIRRWDSPQTFFYCDPPYPGTDAGHYSGYSLQDLGNLVDVLEGCQGSFILSNYDQPAIIFPYDWVRYEIKTVCSARKRVGYDRSKKKNESSQKRERVEVLWRRFNRVPVREEIQRLYDSGAYDCFAAPVGGG